MLGSLYGTVETAAQGGNGAAPWRLEVDELRYRDCPGEGPRACGIFCLPTLVTAGV